MAEVKDEKKDRGELCHVSICKAENGWKISCNYQAKQTLSQRAGWTPDNYISPVEYVEKTKAAVIKQLENIL